jgi:hypothetical protein
VRMQMIVRFSPLISGLPILFSMENKLPALSDDEGEG